MYIMGVLFINTLQILCEMLVKTQAIIYTTMNTAVDLGDLLIYPWKGKKHMITDLQYAVLFCGGK